MFVAARQIVQLAVDDSWLADAMLSIGLKASAIDADRLLDLARRVERALAQCDDAARLSRVVVRIPQGFDAIIYFHFVASLQHGHRSNILCFCHDCAAKHQ